MVTGPTFTPTPTPTPIAPNAIQGMVGIIESSGAAYEAVLAGSTDAELHYISSEDDIRIGQLGQIWGESAEPGWQIERAILEFDTSAFKEQPSEVVLRFRMIVKLPGFAVPQAIHRGTWEGTAESQSPETLWHAYDAQPLVTFLEQDTTGLEPPVMMEKAVLVPLPPGAITLGGLTRLILRTTLEGQEPPVGSLNCDTCMQVIVFDNVNLLVNR
jgi:hypothetical protein